ncbi:unnamed protein product, partial [Rotaria socialis]
MANECLICERELDKADDLVTTDCDHTFHRQCAQERLDTKNRTDCRACGQVSALGDALARPKIVSEGECSICESLWTLEDDLVTTECDHTFHYACAQDRLNKTNKTDCRSCHQESALGNALALKNLTKQGECSICELEWNWKDDVVTTICKHTFHRHCAQERLDERNRADCRSCGKESALRDALSKNTTTTNIKNSFERKPSRIEVDQIARSGTPAASPARNEHRTEKKEDTWKCDECSATNLTSTKRCSRCGEPRFAAFSASTAQTQRPEVLATADYNQNVSSMRPSRVDGYQSLYPRIHESTKAEPLTLINSSSTADKPYSLRPNTKQTMPQTHIENIEEHDEDHISEQEAIVYISDLPPSIQDDSQLHRLIESRLEKVFQIEPISIQCYSKLGAGLMRVRNTQIKNRLVEDIKIMPLDLLEGTHVISFRETLEVVSYIVIDTTNEENDMDLPTAQEIRKRWIELYRGDEPSSCDQISVQFPNIYRIVSTSFDDLLAAMSTPDFLISKLFAHVYIGADCSYFEDLPKSTTKEELETAISNSIRMKTVSSLSLHIELNKQTNNACIIATDEARLWTTKSFVYINDRPISKKASLTSRLLVHPVLGIHNDDEIINHTIFDGKASIIERSNENLVLEISDKKIYDNCLSVGVLTPKSKPRLKMEIYMAFTNPENREIDTETWYHVEMVRYKSDIMQF